MKSLKMEDRKCVYLKHFLNEMNEIVKELELIKEKRLISELNNYLEQLKCADSKGLDKLFKSDESNSQLQFEQVKLKLKFKLNQLISLKFESLNQILLVNFVLNLSNFKCCIIF